MISLHEWFQSDEYKKLCEDMEEVHNNIINDLENNLSQDMVADIREWRVGNGPEDINTHSWRGVARLFIEKYPEFSDNHGLIAGNQITGMQLCEVAMKLLNQKTEEGWN
jgi:hypothetical protein